MAETIRIEVVHARPDRQALLSLDVPVGTTVAEAIELSDIRREFPDLAVDPERLGIFSQKVRPEHVLRAGDRVEIYRPLIVDPKESRRRRAAAEQDG